MATIAELFSLEGKVAVVIGGTGTLGGEFCRGLASAGAAVAVIGRSAKAAAVAQQLRDQGHAAIGLTADATDREQVVAACATIEAEWGGVDILVNAPGINSTTPFFDVTDEEWYRVLDANLTAVFHACQVFARPMVERRRGGSIINISSASSGPPLSRVFTYGVAKAGINNLTQFLAREFAPLGIRVNAIAPGFLPAEQNRAILTPERIDAIVRHTPMARLGQPHELTGTLIWLASAQASGFVTGAVIRVDGGFSAMTI